MQKASKVIIVTGANKGIGYSLMSRLVRQAEPSTLVLTSRNKTLGEEAIEKLLAEQPSIKENLHYHILDITKPESIANFADWVNEKFGEFDVIVNNAGINSKEEFKPDFEPTVDHIKKIIGTNYFSTRALTDKFLPMLSENGKIINVSSTLGIWRDQGKTLNDIFTKSDFEEKDIEKAYELYENGVLNKTLDKDNIVKSPYRVSKALMNAWTHYLLSLKLKGDQQCYAMCPGWCRTDLGGVRAPRTPDQGSETIEYLINLPYKADKDLNGKFFADKQIRSF